jgi:hypothetical protein
MLAETLVLAALGISVLGLLYDAVVQRRLIRDMQSHVTETERKGAAVSEDVTDRLRKQDARIDRLQRMVTDQGWRDSMLLTRFDWRKPGDRG